MPRVRISFLFLAMVVGQVPANAARNAKRIRVKVAFVKGQKRSVQRDRNGVPKQDSLSALARSAERTLTLSRHGSARADASWDRGNRTHFGAGHRKTSVAHGSFSRAGNDQPMHRRAYTASLSPLGKSASDILLGNGPQWLTASFGVAGSLRITDTELHVAHPNVSWIAPPGRYNLLETPEGLAIVWAETVE